MAWIEVHQTLPAHRKIKKLKRELKIKTPQAVGHMVMLWLWAVDNAPDGDLSRIDPDDIAEAAEWLKNGQTFVDAMACAGFLDADMRLHDWGEFSGMLMEKREAKRAKDRERQKNYRNKLKQETENRGAECDCHTPVTCDNAVTSRTCHTPNSTLPYPTVPNTAPKSTWEEDPEEKESSEGTAAPSPASAAPARHKYGEYGWVRLSDEEYARLLSDLGEKELLRCIAYVDESAQSNGNRNKWKDWYLVVKKCAKQGWGKKNERSVDRGHSEPTASGDRGRNRDAAWGIKSSI